MATKLSIVEEIKALDPTADVNVDMKHADLIAVLKMIKDKPPEQDEPEQDEPEQDEPEQDEPEQDAPPVAVPAGLVVLKGKSLTGARGVRGPGDDVTLEDFGGDAKSMEHFKTAGYIGEPEA